jgi:trans-aconitate 2-methyltransferase
MPAYKWDAADYAKSSSEQQRWARELIAKLDLNGDERLLDIGCGDGKVTAEIASNLPRGSVVGVDNSENMIALAQSAYPTEAVPNLRFEKQDASSLPFVSEFDVVFSNAALHWVLDHAPVLRGIQRSLRCGGKALLQMGGSGSAADVIATLDELLASNQWRDCFTGFGFPYGFYGPDEYRQWLHEAKLHAVRAELIPKDMVHRDRPAFEDWLRTTWLPYTQRVPEARRAAFTTQLVDKYLEAHPPDANGAVHVKMVRLEVEAIRSC